MIYEDLTKMLQGAVAVVESLIPTEAEREQDKTEETKRYVLVSNLRVGDQVVLAGGTHRVRSIEEFGDGAQLDLGLVGPQRHTLTLYKTLMVEVLTDPEV